MNHVLDFQTRIENESAHDPCSGDRVVGTKGSGANSAAMQNGCFGRIAHYF